MCIGSLAASGHHADERGVEHDELRVGVAPAAERHCVRLAVVADRVVRGEIAALSRGERPRIEETPPALPLRDCTIRGCRERRSTAPLP
jgi:hypothetical protein